MKRADAAVNIRFVRFISGSREELPAMPPAFPDELRYLRERHGEKIAAFEAETETLLGSLSLYPDRDEGGHFFRLAGIDIAHGHRDTDIDASLIEEAGRYIREHRMSRLKFGTSPLLTRNAELYVTRFGARYRWREGVRTPEGTPWPYVSCECDFEDPCARPLDLREEEVVPHSVLDWKGLQPSARKNVVYAGPLSVLLPELTSEALGEAGKRDPEFLPLLYRVFHALSVHGYEFDWFDRRDPSTLAADSPPCYYVMKRILAM
jgi:hypothetical protein